MPKTLSPAMQAHIEQEVTSLCTCWRITRRDGTILGFTDLDQDLVISGLTYVASSGYRRTAVTNDETLAVDNLDVVGILDNAAISAADLRNGLYDYARVEIFLVNWQNLGMGTIPIRRGWFGEITVTPTGAFKTELRGLAQALNYTFGELYSPNCRADLGDTRCKINVGALSETLTISGVSSSRAFTVTGAGAANAFYNGGLCRFTTGANAGATMEVREWNSGAQQVTLFLPMTRTIVVGDVVVLSPGCDKRLDTCINKFNNVVNFRGEPHVPGRDEVLSYPDSQ